MSFKRSSDEELTRRWPHDEDFSCCCTLQSIVIVDCRCLVVIVIAAFSCTIECWWRVCLREIQPQMTKTARSMESLNAIKAIFHVFHFVMYERLILVQARRRRVVTRNGKWFKIVTLFQWHEWWLRVFMGRAVSRVAAVATPDNADENDEISRLRRFIVYRTRSILVLCCMMCVMVWVLHVDSGCTRYTVQVVRVVVLVVCTVYKKLK